MDEYCALLVKFTDGTERVYKNVSETNLIADRDFILLFDGDGSQLATIQRSYVLFIECIMEDE